MNTKSRYALRVSTIRSTRGGGCIFVGVPIDTTSGSVTDAKTFAVVVASRKALSGFALQIGVWLEVTGDSTESTKDFDGFRRKEIRVEAEEIRFLRPSGEHLIRFLADCEEFQGIGIAKARRLWETFGDSLYGILDGGISKPLLSVLTQDAAHSLVAAWGRIASSDTLRYLQANDFDLNVAKRIVTFFGKDAKEKLEEDPYRLLSFCASWSVTDRFAQEKLKVKRDDPRRLLAACEEALYRRFSDGHTCVPVLTLRRTVGTILESDNKDEWHSYIEQSLDSGKTNGAFSLTPDGLAQTIGASVMERIVANAIVSRITSPASPLMQPRAVTEAIVNFEQAEGFRLSPEQLQAVQTVAANKVACISGGAGVGKTTVLKAILAMLDKASVPVHLIALAGRAAKRMSDVTGHPASTIASYLKNVGPEVLANSVLVIDESSMVDLVSTAEIMKRLPESSRLVFVGDHAQLMPVGPGLVFHVLLSLEGVPKVELTTAKRFGDGIAKVANAVRAGNLPNLPSDTAAPVSFVPASTPAAIAEMVLDLYDHASGNTQILCAKKSGPDGTEALNSAIQAKVNPDGAPLMVFAPEFGQYAYTGLRLSDLVLCTRNIYELGLRNGSLGRIVEVEPQQEITNDVSSADSPLAWIVWDDGERRPLFNEILNDIELGYALTVHKAQGSQWQKVIVPISKSRNLDRSLIYTAITRAQTQVILIGDNNAAAKSVREPPSADRRCTGLGPLIYNALVASCEATTCSG